MAREIEILELEQILCDRELSLAFREFLHSVLCSENLSFWYEVEEYRTIINEDERKEKAKQMLKKYLSSSSTYQLNLNFEITEELRQLQNQAPNTLFDKAQYSVTQLLRNDSLPKFLVSEQFQTIRRKQKTILARLSKRLGIGEGDSLRNRSDSLRMLETFLVHRPTIDELKNRKIL
eukprot:TRINITY_DN8213_c0_g1_i1.p1 TRINITY_DN8213_c0_g1~~TRINITY_DN8213_c0_g1_i1.p1  ORF type:complete len:177 (-),score=72.12 TRINITY_DN8213_c0_g1_i1:80-610(-)